jgi:hypothetical protein
VELAAAPANVSERMTGRRVVSSLFAASAHKDVVLPELLGRVVRVDTAQECGAIGSFVQDLLNLGQVLGGV